MCFNYFKFFKGFLKNKDLLSKINNFNINHLNISLDHILKKELTKIETLFKFFAEQDIVHQKFYTDEQKMAFFLNFFNLRFLHQIFFGNLMNKKAMPIDRKEWRRFLREAEFRLFGLDLSLWDLEITVIRYFYQKLRKKTELLFFVEIFNILKFFLNF